MRKENKKMLSPLLLFLTHCVMNLRPQSWSKEETLYRVYIRELNKELCTGLSTLYTKTSWFVLTTPSLP